MRIASPFRTSAVLGLVALVLAGCSSSSPRVKRVKTGSVSVATVSLMRENDMPRGAPILMRLFKQERILEVWKQERSGRYGLLKTYEICKFSGKLGPKIREGDRQAPEGFYAVASKSLNPFSRNHLAFNIGFPNAFDRSLGRTGTHLMVHGGCSSIGCYAMTHKSMEEIYALARESLLGGQTSILFQAFPFRMTAENLDAHADNPNIAFWENLKEGHDLFQATGRPPAVAACGGRYAFSSTVRTREEAAGMCRVAAPAPAVDSPYDDAYAATPAAEGYDAEVSQTP